MTPPKPHSRADLRVEHIRAAARTPRADATNEKPRLTAGFSKSHFSLAVLTALLATLLAALLLLTGLLLPTLLATLLLTTLLLLAGLLVWILVHRSSSPTLFETLCVRARFVGNDNVRHKSLFPSQPTVLV